VGSAKLNHPRILRHCITVGSCKVLSVWLVNIHVHSYINIQIHIHIQVHMFIKIHLDIHINIDNDNNNTNSNRKSNMKRNCTLLFVDWMLETGVELEDPPTSPRVLLVLELNFISVSVCLPHFLICSSCDHPFFHPKASRTMCWTHSLSLGRQFDPTCGSLSSKKRHA
jgi:hypothetical protein